MTDHETRVTYFQSKLRILQLARERGHLSYRGAEIHIYNHYSQEEGHLHTCQETTERSWSAVQFAFPCEAPGDGQAIQTRVYHSSRGYHLPHRPQTASDTRVKGFSCAVAMNNNKNTMTVGFLVIGEWPYTNYCVL